MMGTELALVMEMERCEEDVMDARLKELRY